MVEGRVRELRARLAWRVLVVAAVDSSFWYVSAPDEVLARAAGAFHEFTEVETGAVRLSTWGRDYGDEGPALLPLKIDVERRL
jgi:hypothetical protein